MLEYDRIDLSVVYASIIILYFKILIIKDIYAMGVMICL